MCAFPTTLTEILALLGHLCAAILMAAVTIAVCLILYRMMARTAPKRAATRELPARKPLDVKIPPPPPPMRRGDGRTETLNNRERRG